MHLASIKHMADVFARAMMSATSAAKATRIMCPSLPSVQWWDELAMAMLTGMSAVDFFVADVEDTEADAPILACINHHVQHILSLPAQL